MSSNETRPEPPPVPPNIWRGVRYLLPWSLLIWCGLIAALVALL